MQPNVCFSSVSRKWPLVKHEEKNAMHRFVQIVVLSWIFSHFKLLRGKKANFCIRKRITGRSNDECKNSNEKWIFISSRETSEHAMNIIDCIPDKWLYLNFIFKVKKRPHWLQLHKYGSPTIDGKKCTKISCRGFQQFMQ